MFGTATVFFAVGLVLVGYEPGRAGDRAREYKYYTFDAVSDATATNPQGINARGDIVGSYTSGGVTHGFLLSDGVLTTIDYPGAAFTDARGINAKGDIVGAYRMPGEPPVNVHGYLRDKDGQMTPFGVPDHTNTIPQRITNTGLIVGCRHDTDTMATMRGIVIDPQDLRDDGDVDEYGETDLVASMNNGASPDGRLIVGLYTDMMANHGHGYLLYGETVIPFDVPGSTLTAGWDVNTRGEVVGVYRDAGAVVHGFVWSDLQFTTLDVPGATATRAFGINSRGVVVGNYLDKANKLRGFVAIKK
jgi:uncharacterized membrane protein